MLNFLPWPLLLLINCIIITINVLFNAIPIILLAIVKLILPFKAVTIIIEKCNYLFFRIFIEVNSFAINLTNKVKWDIKGNNFKPVKKSCIIISNHLSWADIIILCHIYKGKIPTTKFFLKHSLIYIPFVGLACLGLGMPFLRRYSKAQLIKNPKLKNKDIQTTKKACKNLVFAPSTLVNFVEGTRYTKTKAKLAKSPYQHLMLPKAPSLAIALGQIGKNIDVIFNTTLCYKHNSKNTFIDMLKGKLTDVYARVEQIPITDNLIGDYLQDKNFKHNFSLWIRDIWAKKDLELDNYLNHDKKLTNKEKAE